MFKTVKIKGLHSSTTKNVLFYIYFINILNIFILFILITKIWKLNKFFYLVVIQGYGGAFKFCLASSGQMMISKSPWGSCSKL